MVDFVRLRWRDKSKLEHFVCQEENFRDLEAHLVYHTGDIKYPYSASFNSIDVKITNKFGYVYNSIHKAYNDKCFNEAHNHNDFGYHNMCEIIDHIENRLTDIENSKLTQLEFGFNLKVPVPAEQIISNNVLMHKYRGPNRDCEFSGSGKLKQFEHSNYIIKIYDKAKQYGLSDDILRFEIKFKKAREFDKLDIFRLSDLKDKLKLRRLQLYLILRFKELLIVDEFKESEISTSDLALLNKYINPQYWLSARTEFSGTTIMRKSREHEKLLQKYNLVKTKTLIRQLLEEKYIQLINF